MVPVMRLFFATLVAAVAAMGGCGDSAGPTIDQVIPTAAARGAEIQILGQRFCGDAVTNVDEMGACVTPPAGFVTLGETDMVRASVRSWKAAEVRVVVPQSIAAGSTVVIVTVDGASSNAAAFEVL